MDDSTEKLLTAAGTVILWFAISQFLGRFIVANYFFVDTISLLLVFGLIYEFYTSATAELDFLDFVIEAGKEFGRTGAQLAVIFGVTSLVVSSIMIKNWVEATFGALAVVQLLAVIAVISRAFVALRAGGHPGAVLDGNRGTYMVYTVGFLAILLSYGMRGTHPPYTAEHNAMVIFLSTLLPAVVFYGILRDVDLPSLEDSSSQVRYEPRRRRR